MIVGKPEEVAEKGFKLDGATIIDNTQGELRKEMAEAFYELRKSKGVTPEEAEAQMDDVMYFGTMLLKTGHADGLVGGACHATKDVLHPALRIIKTAPGSKLVSSFFVMEVPNCEFGDAGTFMFSDCAVCIQPNAEDLSEIAVAPAKSYDKLLGAEARVAMLSHSSYGSVKDDDTQKVVEALALAKQKAPEFAIDGELQADAAPRGRNRIHRGRDDAHGRIRIRRGRGGDVRRRPGRCRPPLHGPTAPIRPLACRGVPSPPGSARPPTCPTAS